MQRGILSISADALREWVRAEGLPAYRAGQIAEWAYGRADGFEQMTNLPAALRRRLSEDFVLREAAASEIFTSEDGTKKIVFDLTDGEKVEGVLMKHRYGNTVCVSTQAGCRMGCRFCASPPAGYCRGLTPGEILWQVIGAGRECGGRVDKVVLMGIGEPLDNFENVVEFLKNISSPEGYAMSLRNVSLSTCGLAERIKDLAEYRFGLTLSISLHAPNDTVRDRLMPINKKYNIKTLLQAADFYAGRTGRRICYEYALIAGVNDSPQQAAELAALLRGRLAHVNLISCNPVEGTGFLPPTREAIQRFCGVLEKGGVGATVRRTMGADLNASCGQLRRKRAEAEGS